MHNPIFFTPGPTQLYPSVPQHIDEALKSNVCSLSHRSVAFSDIFAKAVSGIRSTLNVPDEFEVYFMSSATEAMERVIQNLSSQKTAHLVNGGFSERFFDTANAMKRNTVIHQIPDGCGFSSIDDKVDTDVELVCITHNETSTGVVTDSEVVRSAREIYPNALVALDIVSSVPMIDIDLRDVDCAFFSVQKGFGIPAGLGVVLVNSKSLERCRDLERRGYSTGYLRSFVNMSEASRKKQTKETPNMLGIYLLGKVCEDMLESGIDRMRQETKEKAKMLYDFFDSHENFDVFAEKKAQRSESVLVVKSRQPSASVLEIAKREGFVLGAGYSKYKNEHIRVANFPAHSKENVRRLIDVLSGSV